MVCKRWNFFSAVLCLVPFALAWAGNEAVTPPEDDRLLVTAEHGLLTVVAQEVEILKVLEAITSQSGIAIVLVNAPTASCKVTITVAPQPLRQALPHLLEALRTSVALSYVVVQAEDRPPWVKIFFAETAQGADETGGTAQEEELRAQELPPEEIPQEEVVASEPTEEEQQGVIETLQEFGVATEELDEDQLLVFTLRLAQGLLVPEGQELPLPADPVEDAVAAAPSEAERQGLIEVLRALGVTTEQLDEDQLLEFKLRLAQGLLVHEGQRHTD